MRLSRRAKIALGVLGVLIVLIFLSMSLVGIYVNWLWFGELGFRGVYSKILITRIVLFVGFGLVMAAIIGGNIALAYRLRPPFRPMSPEQTNLERYRIALEPRKKLAFIGLLVIFALAAGAAQQSNWSIWQLWMNGGSFGVKDPQFNMDISFYAWDYPLYRLILGFMYVAIILTIILSAGVYYLYGALRLQTPGPKITISARRHLTALVFVFLAMKAVSYWLDRYGLVFSNRGKVTGASYADVNATLPAKTILFWLAIIIAVGVLASIWLSGPLVPAIGFGVLLILSIVISGIYPALVQQITVKPNASVKEAKFISRNIEATRAAYDINTVAGDADNGGTAGGTVNYVPYAGTPTLSAAGLESAAVTPTIDNIRVLDPNVVSPTFTQLQNSNKAFYGFSDKLDIDRYTINGQTKDYVVGVRDIKPSGFDAQQGNWINKHTFYTHGYGYVGAYADRPVNTTAEFAEGNIPPTGVLNVKVPQVYYGEQGVDYSIVGSKTSKQEYDGADQTNTYAGKGGVKLSNVLTRAAFALKYGQLNFLLNNAASSNGAKIIFNRDPRERVQKVAPYLKVDGDPYPSVTNDGRIVWILDGYTTMSQYPYAEKEQLGNLTEDSLTQAGRTDRQANSTFNYIRNSVKATVDAYDGTVNLYAWNDKDPLLKAWMRVFPNTVKPKSAMPTDVLAHIRYPQDLFEVQRALLARYHVTDPVQFYNASNQWSVPTDPYATAGDQPPYYLLAGDPTQGSKVEYQLTSPMRANNRENLSAYISVNSEATSPDYGKLTVLQLPTSSQTIGPKQVANQFQSEAKISQEVNIFDLNNSKVVNGNLLSLPVGGGFLYVEPLYVQGSGTSSQPLLRRVIVYYGNKIGYDEDLAGALRNLNQSVVGAGINDGTTSQTPGSSPTTPPATSSPTTTAPSTGTPSAGSTGSPQIDAVLKQLDAAAIRLSEAYKTGNLAVIGQAQADLKKLAEQYVALRAAATKSPAPSTTR